MTVITRSRQVSVVSMLACLLGGAAAAQAPPALPRLPSPAETVRPEERALPPTSPIPEAPPPGVAVRPLGGAEAPPGAEAVMVTLQGITLEGVTVYREAELAEIWQDKLGQSVPLTELFAIARAIEARYRTDGYILSRVVVPEQEVSDGRFKLTAIEGYIGEITVQGELNELKPRIEAMLAKIAARRPANISDIDRYLLLVNDLPGVSARGTLRPGNEPGSSQLVVDVALNAIDAYGTVNNRGSRFAGPWSATLGLGLNAQTDMGDRNEFVLFHTLDPNQLAFGQYTFTRSLGYEGTKLKLTGGYSRSLPGNGLELLRVQSVTGQLAAHVTHPIIRSRRFNLGLDLGFDLEDSSTNALNQRLIEDRTRTVRLVGTADYRDGFRGVTAYTLGAHRGLDVAGASNRSREVPQSRAQADAEFWKFTGEISRLQGIYADEDISFNLFGTVGGQWSVSPLLASEQFRLGGERFGRGYVPAELSGDNGIGTSVEAQLNAVGAADTRFQIYLFYDFGKVWQLSENVKPTRPSLASDGIGVRTQLTDWLSIDGEVAKALTRIPTAHLDGEKPIMGYLRVTVRY